MTAPIESLPPDAPATVEDVRGTRRWTWVAFAWAIAASIIAVLALVQANQNDNSGNNQPAQTGPDLSNTVRRFQDQTNQRLDAFSRRLNDRAAATDVTKLDKRLSDVEDAQSKSKTSESDQADTIQQLQSDVKDLQDRVDKLEQQQSQNQNSTP